MKKQTLWKRIFGQKPNKKVKAQQAFQEQFDTKLRFRELEPRVVLAAAVLDGSGNLTITIDDGDTVELGRDSGDLTIKGITSLDDNGTITNPLVTDVYTFTLTEFASVTVNAGADAGTASNLVFADSLGDLTNSFTTGDLSINGIDLVDIGNSLDSIKIGGDLKASNTGNSDNSDIGNDGAAVLEGTNIVLDEVTGNLNINLNDSNHKFAAISGTASSVLFKDADDIELGALVADSLEITAGGKISDAIAVDKIEVSGLASFSGSEVDLDNTTSAGHDFNKLTLNATGTASIVETDGFDFDGLSIIGGALTVDTGGAIGQIGGSELRANSSAGFKVGDASAITLNEMVNRFEGTVSVTGQTDRAGAVTFYDSNGGFQFGSVLATTLDLTTTGGISQTSDGIDVSGNAVFTTMGANAIVLNSTNNAFGANVSATGNGGPAATATIVDSDGTLTLDDVQAATLSATAINGGIAQTGTGIQVTGTSSFTVQDGEDVLLTTGAANNAFGDAISISGASAAAGIVAVFQATGDLKLGAIDATTLTIALDDGSVSQTSAGVQVSGDAQLAVGDMKDILLNGSSNNVFGGELDLLSGTGTAASAAVNNSGTGLLLDQVELSGNLSIVTNGGITQTNAGATDYVRVGGTSSFTVSDGANVELGTNTNNQFNTVSAQGQSGAAGTVSILDSDNGIILGAINAGTLNVSAATTIGQTAAGVVVTGTSSFTSGDGQDINLNSSANSFGDAVSASGATLAAGNLTIVTGVGDLKLGAIDSATAALSASAGKIWQTSDGVQVAGSAQFTSGIGKDILLNSSSNNDFGGAVTLAGAGGNALNVALNNSGTGLLLDRVEASGNLTIMTNGGITQTNAGATDYVRVGGTSSFTVSDGDNVELGANTNNRFNVVNAQGQTGAAGDVLLYDSDGNLTLGDIVATNLTAETTAGGIILGAIDATNLNVTSATNITQTTDGVKVSGASSFVVGFFENVTLDDDDNEFNEVSIYSSGLWAGTAIINDNDSAANGITLAKIDAWVLDVTTVGAIQDTAAEEIFATTATFDGGSLDLTNYVGAGHDLNEITLQIDGDAKFNDAAGGIAFTGDNSVGGLLEVTSSGQIALFGGKLVVTGTTDLTAGGIISLSGGMNDFQDTVTLSGTDITIQDANGIELGDVTANSLNVDAFGGHITQAATTILDIATTTVARATTGFNVILGNDNDFTGSVSVVGFSNPTDVVLNDVNDLIIADIDSVTLTATAGKSITQQAGTSILASTSADLTAGTTITLRDVTTPTLSLTAGDTISQEAGTSLLVSGMTMVEVAEGVTVDLSELTNELGSISVNDSNTMATPGMEVYAGTVTIYDGGNDNADALADTDDDGLTLKNIWADMLTVTSAGTNGAIIQEAGTAIHADKTGASSASLTAGSTITLRDITTPTLNLTAGKGISQESGTALIVSGMTTVEVGTGENVDLSNADNDFGSIGVVGTGATAAGDVTIVDADGGIVLKDIIATNLMVTVNDTADVVLIDQMAATSLNVSGMATFVNNTGGNVLITQTANQLNQVGATSLGGIVSIYDAEGGIELKDIVASVLTVTVDDSMNVVNVTQVANTTINVSAGTSIDNQTGGNVDLSNAGNLLNTIFVSAVGMGVRGDVTIRDDDGGLALASITAANLDVTVNDTMDVVNVTQVNLTNLDVTSMTTVTNNTGGNILLGNDNLLNQFGAITSNGGGRGDVVVNDVDGGIELKDVVAENLTVTVDDSDDEAVDITQATSATIDVNAMSLFYNYSSNSISMVGGDVILSNSENKFAQIGVIAEDPVTKYRGDVTIVDDYDGLILKDIVAANLSVTVNDAVDVVHVTQLSGTKLDVTSMTTVTNNTGGDILLGNDNLLNQFGATTVRGSVVVVDSDGGIVLKDIVAGNLDVTVNDTMDVEHVTQLGGTKLDVTSMTTVTNNTGGDILLGNDNLLNQFGAITNNGGVRGDVVVNDVDGGIELKNIVAENLTVTVDDSDDETVDITQAMSATIDVTSMSLFYNYSSNSVDEVGGNVILSNSENKFAQIGVIAEDPVTKYRGDVTIVDDYDGLILKDIVAANLTVTVDDPDDEAVDITQEGGATIDVSEMATFVNKSSDSVTMLAGKVDVSNDTNLFHEISVISEDPDTGYRGDVLVTDANDVILKDFIANTLLVKAGGDVTQPVVDICDDAAIDANTKIIVDDWMRIYLTDEGMIDLQYGRNDIGGAFTVGLDDGMGAELDRLTNFHLRNENATPVIFRDALDMDLTDDDLPEALASGEVDNVTLIFPNVSTDPLLPFVLPEIVISGDLVVEVAGKLTQYTQTSLRVGGDADFIAGQIQFATEQFQDVIVTGHATFVATSGPIEVGVEPKAINSIERGAASDADVEFGYLTFNAQDAVNGHVTITEDDQMTLINDTICMVDYHNVAKSAVLTSTTAGIETGGVANVTVEDLTSLKAVSDIVLGDNVDADVDLRILYIGSASNVSLVEQNDANGLSIVDGTTVTGTLAIQTDQHIVQVNEFRSDVGVMAHKNIEAKNGLFVTKDGGVLLTSVDFDTLAVSAEGTPLSVTQDSDFNFGLAGISTVNGFGGVLTADKVDAFLPDENTDAFASAARADSFTTGAGENYSIVVVDIDDLTIGDVADSNATNNNIDDEVTAVEGIRTYGAEAGHVFVRTKGGDLTFDAGADSKMVVGLANSGVITALASGELEIKNGGILQVTDGAIPDASPFALVTTVVDFMDSPDSKFEIDNTLVPSPNEGPTFERVTGNVNTYLLDARVGKDSTATIELTKLGLVGSPDELDFEVVLNFADTTPLQEVPYTKAFDTTNLILHDIPWQFATSNASTVVTLQAYNSSQINLFGNVADANNFNNLNLVVDQFELFFTTIPEYTPEMTSFVRPVAPYVAPFVIQDVNPAPYAALPEITDDTRVATQIDGVTVVEVDPSNLMEIRDTKVELDDDFMTLDAVKEYIQNGVQFPVGLYKIEILYPGAEEPEVYFYWKQDRIDWFDLSSNDSKPAAPKAVELAVAGQAHAQLSAEEVWAREYDKWFPGVADQQPMEDLLVPAAEGEAGDMIPSDGDILLERVTTVSLQEIDRMTDRLRAKRSIVRDSLSGAMIGGAALMAAVAAQGRKDDEAPNHHPEEQGPQPEESLDETSLGRLRRRVRQWL